MSEKKSNVQEIVEAIDERERRPLSCVHCGAEDRLGPLNKIVDGRVAVVCDDCRDNDNYDGWGGP